MNVVISFHNNSALGQCKNTTNSMFKVFPTAPECSASPRHDPDEDLFNFISRTSFFRLPLSLLQQCLREV